MAGGSNEALMHIIKDPAIWIVITVFLSLLILLFKSYTMVGKNLTNIYNFIRGFTRSELNFRFKEFDDYMSTNPYVTGAWAEFKNTLIFSEDLSMKDNRSDDMFQKVSASVTNIQTTIDPIYFFNEESLVTSKYDHKLLGQASTFLTGLGPVFTFLNIAIAFSKLDFSSQETILSSIAAMMLIMQVAALVSVMAVSGALIFIACDKLTYSKLCRKPLELITEHMYRLFSNISSEKFLIELLKETKIQNNTVTNLVTTLPSEFKTSFDKSIINTLVPFLENMIYGINKVQEKLDKIGSKSGMDDLF